MVIVVEDDPSVLRSMRRLIVGAGFAVRTFDRPSALLDSELPTSNACFVVDLHLPEMNGVELCEKLAASNRLMPVILVTGHTDRTTMAMAARIHAVALLFKPFSRSQLLEAISHALEPRAISN